MVIKVSILYSGLHFANVAQCCAPSEAASERYFRPVISRNMKSQHVQIVSLSMDVRCNTSLQQVVTGIIHGCHMLYSPYLDICTSLPSNPFLPLVWYQMQSLHLL
jgi:hypothetical protein